MNIEIRSDKVIIEGYVNATEKLSKPLSTQHGVVLERIEEGAFGGAIKRADNITLTVDHEEQIYAETKMNTLDVREDKIGFYAKAEITDENLMTLAKRGKIKGWSFGMYNIVDEIRDEGREYPIRKITALDMDHVTLIVNKIPAYNAMSVEVRSLFTKSYLDTIKNINLRTRFLNCAYGLKLKMIDEERARKVAYIQGANGKFVGSKGRKSNSKQDKKKLNHSNKNDKMKPSRGEIRKRLIGKTTSDGRRIKAVCEHAIDRMLEKDIYIENVQDSLKKAKPEKSKTVKNRLTYQHNTTRVVLEIKNNKNEIVTVTYKGKDKKKNV